MSQHFINMILRLFLLISPLVFFSVEEIQSDSYEKYFEGQITYQIEYSPYSTKFNKERIKELIGSKMIFTFKNGDYKKQYYSPRGELVQERILNLKDNKSYWRTHDSDTVFWIDILKNESPTTFEILKDSILQDYPCKVIKAMTSTSISGKKTDEKKVEIETVYKYAKNLPVNPNWYQNYNEGNFNQIIKYGKGIAIETIIKGLFWEHKITFKSIVKRKVKKRELQLDNIKNAPFKEL